MAGTRRDAPRRASRVGLTAADAPGLKMRISGVDYVVGANGELVLVNSHIDPALDAEISAAMGDPHKGVNPTGNPYR